MDSLEEIAFDLGACASRLRYKTIDLHSASGDDIESDISHIEDNFPEFQRLARKLGKTLPNLPPLQDASPNQTEQFVDQQILDIEHLITGKGEYLTALYGIAYHVQKFYFCSLDHHGIHRRDEEDAFMKAQSKLLEFMRKCSENRGVDISQLEEEVSGESYFSSNEEKQRSLQRRLRKALCQEKKNIENSEIDPSRLITDESWAVSLVRMPERNNSQHAFLVIEGKTCSKWEIWFADFVARKLSDTFLPGTKDGKVRIDHHYSEVTSRGLLFKCQKKMMNVQCKKDVDAGYTWSITRTNAERLIEMIKKKEKDPPKYNVFGDRSVLAASSAESSGNSIGHNCFTFARMMLKDLNALKDLEKLEDIYELWIGSQTSRFLPDKQPTSRKWYRTSSFQLMFAFLAGLAIAFFLSKAFYLEPK